MENVNEKTQSNYNSSNVNNDKYLTPLAHIEIICQTIGLPLDQLTNVYNYGSHVHGSQRPDSDYDLLIVGKFHQEALNFKRSKDEYFYDFEMINLEIDNRSYDIIYHSNANFEKLLEINFLMFVEVLFTEERFRPISKINYKDLYLQKWYTLERIKNSLTNELTYSKIVFKRFRLGKIYSFLDGRWVLKKMFNALRYHDSVLRFLKTGTFGEFGTSNDIKNEILSQYDMEGDHCLNSLYDFIYLKIQKYLVKINNFKPIIFQKKKILIKFHDNFPIDVDQSNQIFNILRKYNLDVYFDDYWNNHKYHHILKFTNDHELNLSVYNPQGELIDTFPGSESDNIISLVSRYIIRHLFYRKPIDLKYYPQHLQKPIEFSVQGILSIIDSVFKNNPRTVKFYHLDQFPKSLLDQGIYLMAANNQRMKVNWCPGITGLPLTPKPKDPSHELVYLFHDICHHTIRPDLLYCGNDSQLGFKVYIISRMMSEAISLVFADMLFVDSMMQNTGYQTVNDRKIYPLFELLKGELKFKTNYPKALKKLLKANVYYCIFGDDSYYFKILDLPHNEEIFVKELEEYKEKYSQFYIKDYEWTQSNYQQMKNKSDIYYNWWQYIKLLNEKFKLDLFTIDDLISQLALKPDMDNVTLLNHLLQNQIQKIFTILFKNNNNCSNIDDKIIEKDNDITKAFIRYMANQLMIFFEIKVTQTKEYLDRIFSILINIEKVTSKEIHQINNLYLEFLDICVGEGVITLDDKETYCYLYSNLEPSYVNYDEIVDVSLAEISEKILNTFFRKK